MHISMFYMISGDSFFCPKNVLSRIIKRISLAQLCTKKRRSYIAGNLPLQDTQRYIYNLTYKLATEWYPDSQEFVLVVY